MPSIDKAKISDRPKWLNTLEAAAFMGVTKHWLDKTRMKGGRKGPTFTKMGGTVVYKKRDLLQYLEENTHRTEDD